MSEKQELENRKMLKYNEQLSKENQILQSEINLLEGENGRMGVENHELRKRLNTLEKVYLCLRDLAPEVVVPAPVRLAAPRPIEKMLSLS